MAFWLEALDFISMYITTPSERLATSEIIERFEKLVKKNDIMTQEEQKLQEIDLLLYNFVRNC